VILSKSDFMNTRDSCRPTELTCDKVYRLILEDLLLLEQIIMLL